MKIKYNDKDMNRKKFIKSILGASAFASIPFNLNSKNINIQKLIDNTKIDTDGSMIGFKSKKIPKVKVGIIGLGNRGTTLLKMFNYLVQNNYAEIIALSDIKKNKLERAKNILLKYQSKKPKLYSDINSWKDLAKRTDIDLIIIATPWKLHTSMSLYAMNQGKHVACEVPISITLEECWKIVKTAEKTKKHCIMMENCNYNDEELWILNMVQEGVFGDITHAEGAYLHDLRSLLLDEKYYENQWRLQEHVERNGNFYTTHGLGPISFYLNIGRGDTFSYLTSMSSRELNLSIAAKKQKHKNIDYKCGDMNNTIIKTKKGKTILLQFDVHTGRPYSRINKLVGTKAVHDGYPSRLYIDDETPKYWGHNWINKEDYNNYIEKYKHPIIKKLKNISLNFKEGHGGMDFIMIYRLIRCLNLGVELDINVYDSVMWSVISPLSELSVSEKSTPIDIPDFTNGKWKNIRELEIMREI